jgi:hypothetical protein
MTRQQIVDRLLAGPIGRVIFSDCVFAALVEAHAEHEARLAALTAAHRAGLDDLREEFKRDLAAWRGRAAGDVADGHRDTVFLPTSRITLH